jgi:glucokinase
MTNSELALVGDIGATNSRFALILSDGTMTRARVFASVDFTDIGDAIIDYLAGEETPNRPTRGVLAIAAAMVGDRVTMTNHPWSFSIDALRRRLGLNRLRVINDFAANALSIPNLGKADVVQVGPGSSRVEAPIGVIGPGTGLGVGALLPGDGRAMPLQSEGGHVTMPAANARETDVLELMRQRFDHVSAERVLSGPGLIWTMCFANLRGCQRRRSRQHKSPIRELARRIRKPRRRHLCSVRCWGPWPVIWHLRSARGAVSILQEGSYREVVPVV